MNCKWIWIALVALGLVVGCSDDPGTTPTDNDDIDAGVQEDASDSNDDDPDAAPVDDADDPQDADDSGDADNSQDAGGDDCASNADCPGEDEFCDRPPGCDKLGTCEPIPDDEACMDVVTPYCDCNGETQQSPNSCIYDVYEHEGACEEDEDDNGDDEQEDPEECELNEDCPESGTYCDREPGCEEPGTCEPIPEDVVCAQVITIYCDCQGHTQQSSDACIWEPYEHEGACEEGQ